MKLVKTDCKHDFIPYMYIRFSNLTRVINRCETCNAVQYSAVKTGSKRQIETEGK